MIQHLSYFAAIVRQPCQSWLCLVLVCVSVRVCVCMCLRPWVCVCVCLCVCVGIHTSCDEAVALFSFIRSYSSRGAPAQPVCRWTAELICPTDGLGCTSEGLSRLQGRESLVGMEVVAAGHTGVWGTVLGRHRAGPGSGCVCHGYDLY